MDPLLWSLIALKRPAHRTGPQKHLFMFPTKTKQRILAHAFVDTWEHLSDGDAVQIVLKTSGTVSSDRTPWDNMFQLLTIVN